MGPSSSTEGWTSCGPMSAVDTKVFFIVKPGPSPLLNCEMIRQADHALRHLLRTKRYIAGRHEEALE
jgi:hypothetical protein